jgi:vacuolar-type H+-ATPase subunit H
MSDTQTTGSPSMPPPATAPGAPSDNTNTASAPPIIDQAKQQAQKVVEQTQQKAGEVLGQAKDRTKSWAEDQKTTAVQHLTDVAQAVHQTGESLRQQNPDYNMYAEITSRAADAVERASGYLRNTSVDQMINEVERFGKQEPVLFLVSAAALGFLAARFLKSSGHNVSGGTPEYNPDRSLPVPIDAQDQGQNWGQGQNLGQGRDSGQGQDLGIGTQYGTTSAAG